MNENEINKIHQLQVGYILNPGLNINKSFREKVESNLDFTFEYLNIIPILKSVEEIEHSCSFTSDVL